MKTYPLTETQLGMFLEWNADRTSSQYVLCFVYSLPKSVDPARLERAVLAAIDAHPVFRTRFVEQDGEVRQYADSGLSIAFAHRQMSVAEADRYEQTLPRPMDLFAAPLVRFEMIETPEGSRMVVECSHLLLDGTAIQTIVADVSSLYAGGTPTPEALSFLDYAEKEADSFESDDYREAAAEAKARFSGRSMTVPDAPRAPKPGEGLADFIESACEIDRAGIDAFCRANGVHPNLFFLGVFARALSLFSNERDVIFHTVNHGRREPSVRSVVGLLVKTVPVCCELKGDRPLVDWLKGLRLHRAGVYPFTHFCRDLGMTGGWGFVYQEGTILDALTLDGVVVPSRWQMSGGSDEMPTLQVFGGTQTYLLKATAKPVRYDTAFLRDFVARCAVIAANFAAADPSTKLGEIPTLVADERRRVLELAKGEDLDYDASKTFVGLFSERVAAAPEATAVVDAEETLSYGELAARANALAAQLAESGVKPGGFVGLMLPRTAAFPTAMIAVQMCGAGYVPMDAEYPADRLAYMLENSEAPVLVTTRALFEGKDLDFKGKVVFLEGGGEGVGGGGQRLNNSTPDTPAYMIYTSGSTGKPKGVVIPNRALTAMIAWMTRDFGLGPGKRNLSITSFSFDASVPDLFPPLAAGGELHILGEERRKDLEGVRDYAAKVGATGLTTSTQLGLALVNTYPELPLEYMLLGGEKMVPFAKTSVRVVNGYGPTEFAVCSSYHEVDQTKTYDIPIGRAVANTWSFVVDRLGQPVPPGMRGEIALAGAQIADGYWRLPEKTAQAFVDCPWREGKMYLTGDYARYDADGELTYEGRIDFQVKLRGFRIEIGEIEQAAATFAGIGPVAAEVREVAGAKHLVLYYSAAKPLDEAALKAHLEKTLTGYMVPDFFVAVEPMPLTPNGKIDRRKLPAPQADDEPVVEPANESERAILAVVKDVLHADGFGVTHDFNRLGLTSLGAMSLLAKLKKGLGFAISLRTLTERPTVRRLAELLGEEERTARWAERSRARPRRQWYPMSENQRGIYADWLRNPETTQYNVPAAFRFEGVAPAELAAAAEQVLSAHPALKARFVEKDGEIVQQRRDDIALAVPVETLDFEPDAAFFSARMKPFAPDAEALCRATVFASPTSACLFLDIHHTVFDGFSVGILLGELVKALGGEAPAGEAYTAFDAALAERDYLESETVDDDEKWFARYLEGAESTALETSSEGADGKPGEAGRVRTRVKAAAIATRAKEVGVTASDWFLTAFTELLRRVGRADDVCINFVTAGRTDPDVQETVGMFVKTLPVRGVRGAATFAETARRMRASVTDLLDRERSSYVRLSEKLGVRPEILFAFEGGIFDLPAGCSLVSPETDTVKAPLTAMVTPGMDDFELVFEYDRSKYAAREMEMLVGMLARLAENAATAGVDAPLASIALLSPEDSAAVLAVSRGDEIAYDAAKTFVNLFNANVIARPFATAVVGSDGSVTYGELGSRSDALAAKLIEFGVKPGGFVGLMLPRRTGFAVSFVAVQKCGAGYVPMDADYPADRLAYMLENSESPVLVTTRALFAGKNLDFKGKVVFYEDVGGGVGGGVGGDVGVGVNLATPDTPAYMIYTSGSTGKPKGVVIPQRALRHFCAWVIERRGLRPGKKVMEHASFSFDASVMDLLPTLAAGGELHILPEELRKDLAGMRDYVLKNGIEGGTMSTQIGMAFLGTFPDLPLEYLSVGGEKLMPISKTKVKIVNVYGPTEFTVGSSEQVVDQDREGDIPIGRAMPGTWSLVVDRYGQLLPRGYPGEIALVGPQIADGYWRLPEKTAQVFVGCQAVERFAKMYRTGDLGRYGEDGLLYYMGRLDFQVKLRGFRIEIGEIEHRAATFAGVKGVAAEVRDVAGAKHLVLYYGSSEPLDETAFRAHLAASLTDYMVPDYFVRMDPLPMTPNGKINRKLLPTPAGEACATEYVEPVTDAERAIAETYGEILKVPKFGATTDFFAAGGTSLVGIKAVVALQKKGLDVAYGDLFKYKTPRTLAAFLTGASVPSAGAAAETPSAGAFDYGACDYTAIDQLLMATPTELFDGFRRHSLGDVLLCGATGYLGIHVLRHLLETTDATVYALVRPKKGVGPEKRVDSLYVYYFGQRVPKCFRDRLAFVEGDITDSNLSARLSALDSRPSTVFNCAALVKHYVSDDLMDRINVGGVENLVAWCAQSGARLVHASTYSVGGTIRADSAATLDERHLYIGQESDNDYVRTKFLAERAVLEATAAGRIRGKIMRLGNLMGRESDGEFQMNVRANAFVNSLKSYRAIGSYPLEELANRIEMSPIDRVAEAVCLLATTPDGMVVFHPYNAYPLDMGAVIGAMNRRGFDVDCVSRQEFAARVEALRNDPSRAADLQGVLHYAGHLLKDRRMAPAPNAWTTTVLYRLGFRWKPAEDGYLANFLDVLDGLAVFG